MIYVGSDAFFWTLFYFLFYFDGKKTTETTSKTENHNGNHRSRFISVQDGRKRKVRGLWKRGDRYYAQIRVSGEKSARKIPLVASGLAEAKEAMAKARYSEGGALPKGGVKPKFGDYANAYVAFHATARDGRKRAADPQADCVELTHSETR